LSLQVDEDKILLLTKMGLTKLQAELFLTMITTGDFEARTIAKKANCPRQEVYRVLNELQEKGLIEKLISTPHAYRPIPLQDALVVIVKVKEKEYTNVLEKKKEFLTRFEGIEKHIASEHDYTIRIVDGRSANIVKTLKAHSSVQYTVDCCTTPANV
jgi:sugar-specific transcriptional regulator TrmB